MLEAPQAVLDRLHDVGARAALHPAGIVHVHAELRRQHDVLAALAEDLAEEALRAAALAIDVGGVEERDAEIERLVDDLAGRLEVDAAAEIVAAETDERHPKARRSEIALLHPILPHAQPRKLANSRAGTRSVLSWFSGAAVSS